MIKKIKKRFNNLKQNHQTAFSILEVVIVIGMVAVLSYISIASMTETKGNVSADKQMMEVKDVFLATDTIIGDYWDIEEARDELFPIGTPEEILIGELAEYTTVPRGKLADYTFGIDTDNRLVVRYKEFSYNGADNYMPNGGNVAVTTPEPSDVEVAPDDESFIPSDSEWSGSVDGEFKYIGNKTTVVIPHEIKGVRVTSYKNMFEGTKVTRVISNNTNVTDMSYMFKDTQAATLDLSNLDTSSVTIMSYMFTDSTKGNTTKLTTLDLSNFKTSNVVDMEGMFYRSKITTLDVFGFDTSKVVNMSYMFYRDDSFTSQPIVNHINLGTFETSNVYNMRNMFKGANEILGYAKTTADANKLNSSHNKPSKLNFIVIANDKDFKWVKDNTIGYEMEAEQGRGYYHYTGSLNEIAIPKKIKGAAIHSYAGMFSNKTTNQVVSTNSNITNMDRMFYGSKASTIYMERINTKNVTSMSGMFADAVTANINLKNFDTKNVINMSQMFMNSKALTVDLRGFNTSKVNNMSQMFAGYQGVELKLTSFNTSKVSNTTDMFKGAKSIRGYAYSQADANKLNASSNKPGYLHFVILAMDEDFDWIKDSANGYTMSGQSGVGYWRYNGPAIEIELPNQIYGVPVKNYNRMFVNSPVIQVDSYNTNVIDMSGMFLNSTAPKLDLTKINTTGVVNMKDMFNGAKATNYVLSNFDTSKVTNMSGMFANNLDKNLNISTLNTSNVVDMSRMFYNAATTSIDTSTMITAKVTNTSEMFYKYKGSLLKLDSFDVSKVTNTNDMFIGTAARTGYARTQADATKLNASRNKPADLIFVVMATDKDFSGTRDGEFRYIGQAVEVGIPNIIKGVNVTKYNNMFEGTIVKKIESTNRNITDMSYMFAKTTSEDIDISTLYSANVVTMKSMFEDSLVTKLDKRNLNTAKVRDMSGMFAGSKLPSNDINTFNTNSLTNMSKMFYNAKTTSLTMNNINTTKVVNMSSLFEGSSMSTLNLKGVDTTAVTDMSNMFKNSGLTSIDLSTTNTQNVTTMRGIFEGTKINNIDISSWNTAKVSDMSRMFMSSSSLITGIDKIKTTALTNASYMFYNHSKINYLDLNAWNTSALTNTSHMFANTKGLYYLSLDKWNVTKLKDMSNMFTYSKVNTIDLSGWNTSSITATNGAFKGVETIIGYSRTQTDANKLNASVDKPAALIFGVRSEIKFIDQGNTVADIVLATGNKIEPIPKDPVRTGYTFQGWFTANASSGGTKFTPGDLVKGDVTYYARWTINDYKFTFDSKGGSTANPSSITKNYNLPVGALPTTALTGYDFLGWFTSPTGGTKLTTTTRVTSNTAYYAQWKIQNRTFSFNSNGGGTASPSSITKTYDSAVGTLPTVSRTGYIFNGWFTSTSGGSKLSTATKMTSNTIYYAQWTINNKTFSFNGNGGSNATAVTKTHGAAIGTLPTSSRTGYTFNGWYTATSGGSKLATTTAMTSDTTYYAQWTIIRNTLKVNPNGGVFQGTSGVKSITGDYGTDTFVGRPTRTGHTFSHWSQSGTGGVGAYGKHTPGRSNDTSAGYWRDRVGVYNNRGNGTTTATWTGLSGTNPFNPAWPNQVMRMRSTGTDQTPGRGGFVYSTTSAANRVYYHVIVANVPKGVRLQHYNNPVGNGGNFTWLTSQEGTGKPETYIYRLNSGNGGSFSTFGHVAAIGGPSTLTWDIYYTHMFDATGSNGYFNSSELFKFDNTGAKTLTANWTANKYDVTFVGNGAANTTKSVTYGTAVGALPTPSKTGYSFQGWATAQTGGSWVNENYVPNGAVSYYARWTQNSYQTSFNGNGGSHGAAKQVPYGNAVGALPGSSRTGYTFLGWFTATSGGSKVGTDTVPNGTRTYYAQWKVNAYTVTFDGQGGTGTTRAVNYGSAVGALPGSTRTGYSLQGWATATTGGSWVAANTVPNGAKTYYARWTANKYTVWYTNGGGNAVGANWSNTSTYGSSYAIHANWYTRMGWNFSHWRGNVGGNWTAGTNWTWAYTSGATLTAVWSQKSVNTVAKEIINGNYGWGNGQTRKNNLVAAGFNYSTVQAEVNRINR